MPNLNKTLRSIVRPFYVDYMGFADLSIYEADLVKFGGDVVAGYKNGISLGLVIPDSTVDHLPERSTNINAAAEYRIHGYEVLNDRLNLIASIVSSYLNQKGYRTLPIAAAETTDMKNNTPTISHKMIAHIAGLGWIGKNCLLITPEHGPRLRLISILTNAPLDTVNTLPEQRCNECDECVKVCPVKALKSKNYIQGESREERFEHQKCRAYFDRMRETERYPVCGMCLYACPYGQSK